MADREPPYSKPTLKPDMEPDTDMEPTFAPVGLVAHKHPDSAGVKLWPTSNITPSGLPPLRPTTILGLKCPQIQPVHLEKSSLAHGYVTASVPLMVKSKSTKLASAVVVTC
jgi:hypothetical protein